MLAGGAEIEAIATSTGGRDAYPVREPAETPAKWGWKDSNLQPDRYEPTFPASQTESFSVPVIAMSRPSSTRRLGEVGQLDGQQLAVPAGIFRDLVSARASARRLASERFPHLDCRHLLRPSSFAAALAYPSSESHSSLPRFQLTFRKMEMLEVRSQYGFERTIPSVWAQPGTPPCWAQMVLPALPCSLE